MRPRMGVQTGVPAEGPWLAGGSPLGYARDLRPLAAGSARRDWDRLVGTLLARIPEMNQECPRRLVDSPGIQGSVPEEAVHREGRCAPTGEAPNRGVPAAVR